MRSTTEAQKKPIRTPRSRRPDKESADDANSGSIQNDCLSSTESAAVDETLQFTKDEERVIIKSGRLQDIIDHYTTNATVLVQELKSAFHRANSKEEAEKAHTQLRVVNIAKIVFDSYADHIKSDKDLRMQKDLFITEVSKQTPDLANYLRGNKTETGSEETEESNAVDTISKVEMRDSAKAISKMVVRAGSKQKAQKKKEKRRPSTSSSESGKGISPSVTPQTFNEIPSLADFPPEEVAKQLCIINYNQHVKIRFTELHHLSWTKPGKAPNLDIATKYLEDLSLVLANLVLSEKIPTKRAKIISFILQVGEFLLKFQNFQSLMAISLSLSYRPVVRLKSTWKHVSSKHLTIQKRIDGILNPLYNFSAYRLHTKDLLPPIIPCYEVTLKDLLYQHESSPNYLSETVINVYKMECMGKIIYHFSKNRQEYTFPIQSYLYSLLSFLDPPRPEALDLLSITLEPSESESESGGGGGGGGTGTGGSPGKLKAPKAYTFQQVSWDSETWTEFLAFLNQRHTLELEALELYEAVTNYETKDMNATERKVMMQKILFEYLGFNGGDKLVTLSPNAMLELAASVEQLSTTNYGEEFAMSFFTAVKRELCEQIEASFIAYQQPKKK